MDGDGDGVADAPWHFGTESEYPALTLDADGDARATWEKLGHQLRTGPARPGGDGDAGGPTGPTPASCYPRSAIDSTTRTKSACREMESFR